MHWRQEVMSKNNQDIWSPYWPDYPSDSLSRAYYVDGDDLISTANGLRFEDFKEPEYNVDDMSVHAFSYGADLRMKWPIQWGLSVALVHPGLDTAWLLSDNYATGKYMSVGVALMSGVGFGQIVSIFHGDIDQASRFALAQGITSKNRKSVESAGQIPFPFDNKRVKRLWGKLDNVEYMTTINALKSLQLKNGLNPFTAIAALNTVEIILEST
jgi:hypothetical protein